MLYLSIPFFNMAQYPPAPPPSQPKPSSSPTSGNRKSSISLPTSTETVPLDHPSRTTPLHPSLPTVLVPPNQTTSSINPLTLQPFTDAELKSYNFDKLLQDHKSLSNADIEKARDEAVKALRDKIDERDAKVREVEKEIEEKEKIRGVERKVYRRQMEGRKGGDD